MTVVMLRSIKTNAVF